MQEFLKKYIFRHFSIHHLLPPAALQDDTLDFNRFKLSSGRQIWLNIVSWAHWVCLIGFVLTLILSNGLAIDFADWHVPFSQRFFDPLDMLKMLCVSGLIGYGTNYIAIQMLFRPVERRPIWGQGLVPSQRERIIFTLSRGMHKHILHQDIIIKNLEKADFPQKISQIILNGATGILKDKELKDEVKNWIVGGMTNYFGRENIKTEMLSMINQKVDANLNGGLEKILIGAYKKYKTDDYEAFIQKMVTEIPKVAGTMMDKFGEEKTDDLVAYLLSQKQEMGHLISLTIAEILFRLDITSLLQKQMEHFDDTQLERMVWEASNEQLLYIQYLGTLLGLLGGLIIWEPIFMMLVYAFILGILWVIDTLLFNKIKSKASK